MPGRVYTVSVENQLITTADGDVDLLELDAGAEKPIELIGMGIYPLTEVQEAQEEWVRCQVIRGHTTTGNGTATTPRPCDVDDAAAGFTAKIYGATIASAGTAINNHPFGFNVRAGYEIFYPERCGFTTSGTTLLVVRMMAALADAANFSMCFWVLEY
jgi:hypothetical protein